MIEQKIVNGSIVLYQNDIKELHRTIECTLASETLNKLYLIDNSSTDNLKILREIDTQRIVYLFQNNNLGFGKGHNIAIKESLQSQISYHLVINPDIYFDHGTIESMVHYMSQDSNIGMLMPEILNEDQTVQNLPKLLPTPLSLFMRKSTFLKTYHKRFLDHYELRFVKRNQIYNVPILSGCFTLLNLGAIKEVGLYDDNFFMYFEDWDLSRRMHELYKTVYYPNVSVTHGYESGANKSRRLLKIFVDSYITYFNKWGWILDNNRKKVNKRALSQFK